MTKKSMHLCKPSLPNTKIPTNFRIIDLGSAVCFDQETEEFVKVGEKIAIAEARVFHSKYVTRTDGWTYVYGTKEVT